MMSWLTWKLFRKPLLLKIFPKYIRIFFSGVRQLCCRKIVHSCLQGLRNKFSKAANCSSVLSFARKQPLSGLMSLLGSHLLTILFKISFPPLDRGLTSYQMHKAKARRPSVLTFLPLPPGFPPSSLQEHPRLTFPQLCSGSFSLASPEGAHLVTPSLVVSFPPNPLTAHKRACFPSPNKPFSPPFSFPWRLSPSFTAKYLARLVQIRPAFTS